VANCSTDDLSPAHSLSSWTFGAGPTNGFNYGDWEETWYTTIPTCDSSVTYVVSTHSSSPDGTKYRCFRINDTSSSDVFYGYFHISNYEVDDVKIETIPNRCAGENCPQTITFNPPSSATFGDSSISLSASATSGNSVTFTSTTSQCTITGGNTLNIVGAGTCTIEASRAGDSRWLAATTVSKNITINKANQTITFNSLSAKNEGDANFSVSATASSGLSVSFSAIGDCTVSGSTVSLIGGGDCTITAAQSGNTNYNAATDVPQTFAINDTPVITEGASVAVTMSENATPTAFSKTLNATDTDNSGSQLTWSINSQASHGTASVSGTGASKSISYSPNANYNGSDSFIAQISDGSLTDTITINVTIENVNDKPSFTASTPPTISEDAGTQTISNWANFTAGPSNESSQTATYTVSNISNSSLFSTQPNVNSSGTLTYTPAANAYGSSTFKVTVKDNGGTANSGVDTSTTQTFTITINPVNDAPTFTSTGITLINEDSTYTYNITTNDIDGNSLTITAPTKPTWLSFSDNGNGTATLSGTPTNSNVGSNNVTLRVNDGTVNVDQSFTITVVNVNDPPVITQGTSTAITISKNNTPTAFSLTLNATDIDPTNDTLTWSISSPASHGTATASGIGASKAINYTPNLNNTTSDNFTVQVSDGNGSIDTITVNVTFINDPPEITEGDTTMVAMSEDSNPVSFALTLNATDPNGINDTLTWSISTAASHGTASVSGTGISKAINYTPTLNFIGEDNFVVTITDTSGATDTITVTVNVNDPNNPNNAPVANNNNFTINEDTSLSNLLIATDADGNSLTYTKVSEPTYGTLTVTSSTGGFLYTPFDNFSGTDSFTFKANDSTVDSNIATVDITINAVNDAPGGGFGQALDFDGMDDYIQTTFNNNLPLNNFTMSLWFKTTDNGDKKILSSAANIHPIQILNGKCQVCLAGSCTLGTTTINDDNWHFASVIGNASGINLYLDGNTTPEITKSPNSTNMSGNLQIGKSSTGNLEYFAGQIDEVRIWNIVRTEADIQADMYKTLLGTEPGLVAYYPFEDNIGTIATDHKASNDGTLNNMDNADWVNSDIAIQFTISEGQTITNRLPAIDIDSPTLTYTIVNPPTKGTLPGFPNNTGNFTYTPTPGQNGTDSFAYRVSDGSLLSNIVIVNITLTEVNEQPSFTANNPPTVNEDAGTQTITGWITNFNPGTGENSQTVSYLVENVSNPGLFTVQPSVSAIGNLTYTLTPNVSGTSNFDVKIQDSGGTANGGIDTSALQTFTLTVNPVNDQPTFTASNPPAINENAGSQTINNWITGFVPGPTDEVSQTPTYTVSNISNPGLFAVNPAISTTGTLTYTPATNANGSSAFQVSVTDSGNTTNGGINTSIAQSFTIVISALANMPGVTPASTLEDIMTTNGLVISRHPDDGPEVTHFKITNIQGGTLYHNNGLTPINEGNFITFAQASVGLRFLSSANSFAPGSFDIQSAQGNTDADLSGGLTTAIITVAAVNDQPTFTAASPPAINENAGVQSISNWITGFVPGPTDETSQVPTYTVSNISNPSLFAVNPAINTSGELTYTPATNANGTSTFQVTVTDNGGTTNGGLNTSIAQTFTITIVALANVPGVIPASTLEDTMTTSGLVIDRHPDDGPEVTHFKITNIQAGTLYHNNGLTVINEGDFITFEQANVGLRFLPYPNSFAQGSFDIQSAQNNTDTGLSGDIRTATISVAPIADTLTVTHTYAEEGTQSSYGLVISRNEADGDEVTHFKITKINWGNLYKNDGKTVINQGDFITFAEGHAGLKFTPSSVINGNFNIQAALSANDAHLGGDIVTATINVDLKNDTPALSLNCSKPGTQCTLECNEEPLAENSAETKTVCTMIQLFGGLVELKASATDPDVPEQNLRFSLNNAPSGAVINPLTGQFDWQPTEPGQFTFSVIVTDDGTNPNRLSDSHEIILTLTKDPILSPIGPQSVPIDNLLRFTVQALHHNPFTFSLAKGPREATLNPDTGIFNWTPTEEGSFTATIRVTESGGLYTEETITINVELNQPPVLASIAKMNVLPNSVVNFIAQATDPNDNAFIYRLTEAPSGATIHPLTGEFTWIPTQTGLFSVTVEVVETDGRPENLTANTEVEIFVNNKPIISPLPPQHTPMNLPLIFTVKAIHPENHPMIYALVDAPDGAAIDSETGQFIWTPTTEGDFNITVSVTETVDNLEAKAVFRIAVSDNTPPELLPVENQIIPLNRLWQIQLDGTDAQDNQLFYKLDEAPEGMVLHPLNGEMTWIPIEIGTYPVKASVTEIDGMPINLNATVEFEIIVNTHPAIDSFESQKVAMGNTLSYQVTAFHPLGNPLLFDLVNAPAGASIDPNTGLFTWTPTAAGIYDIMIKATDKTNEEFSDTEVVTLIANQVETRLILELSSNTILTTGVLDVRGHLYRETETSLTLEGMEIELAILGPNSSTTIYTQTQAEGSYQFEELPAFVKEGDYLLKAHFYGNNYISESQSESQPLMVRNLAGYAILIQGRTPDDEDGLETYNKTLNRIYQKMKQRGFQDEDIEYFNYNTEQDNIGIQVDAEPNLSVMSAAFRQMQKRLNDAPAPLYVVMVDHGGVDGSFYIDKGDGSKIMPSDVSRWLTNLESGLNQEALTKPRIVTIGSCYSGSFIKPLSKKGRIIITSAAADEESFKGPKEPDERRSGEFFTEAFFAQLARGKSIKTAFELATETTEILTRSGQAQVSDSRFQDNAAQHPLLDDDGDKVGSNVLSTGMGDGWNVDELYLGVGFAFGDKTGANLPAEILQVTDTLYLEANSSIGELFAIVNNPNRVKDNQVIVDIRPPSIALLSDGTEASGSLEIEGLIRMFLPQSEDNRFNTPLDVFKEPGKYEIMYFVVDSQTGEMSPFRRSLVYKNKEGNHAPKPFSLQAPKDKAKPETTLLLNWESTFDPDGDPFSYTLLISTDPDFNKVIYRQEELKLSMTYLDKNTPIDDALKESGLGLRDGTEYFWQVEAIDPYGARAISEVFSLTTNNTNAPPGIGSLHISSALDFSAIDGAEIAFLDEFGNPLPDFNPERHEEQGRYNMLLPHGRRRAVVRVAGFEEQTVALDTTSGFASLNILLEPEGGIPLRPGKLLFAAQQTRIDEGERLANVLVKRVDGSDGEVSVSYTSIPGSAKEGEDYRNVMGQLTWEDQDTSPKRINLTLIDDDEREKNETFNLVLLETTGGATFKNRKATVVTIVDNDWPEEMVVVPESGIAKPGIIPDSIVVEPSENIVSDPLIKPEPDILEFMAPTYIIHEKIGPLTTFTVTRHGHFQGKISVRYATTATGTATFGEDYTGGSGVLFWPEGDKTPKSIHLILLDDQNREGPETIDLYLFSPIGQAKLGEHHQAILGITDDEMPLPQRFPFQEEPYIPSQEESNSVQFSARTYTTMERDGKIVTLMVNRMGDSQGEVKLQFVAMPDSTAFATHDYMGDGFGTLIWVDGEKGPKSITLTLLDDDESEGSETVHFRLFKVTGNVELGLAEANLIINDDDTVFLPSLGQGHIIFPTEKQNCFSQQAEIANYLSEETGECQVNSFFRGGVSVNGEDYQSTLTLSNVQGIHIVGQIDVDANHVGKKADILIVVGLFSDDLTQAKTWLMFDKKGQTLEWDGNLGSLTAAYENVSLVEKQAVEIHQGLSGPDNVVIFFGYYLPENSLIVFNGEQGIQVRKSQDDSHFQKPLKNWPFVNDNELVTISSAGTIRFWDSNTGHRLSHFNLPRTDLAFITLSTDWQYLATAANQSIYLWDVSQGKLLVELTGHEDAIKHISFSVDGQQIATTSWDNTARLWEVETGAELRVLKPQAIVEHANFSPDAQQIITTSWDKTARLWKTETGEELAILEGHQNGVSHAAFSPDGQYIVTTSWDKTARLWKTPIVDNPESIRVLVGHQSSLNHAAFSPDGQRLVTASTDGTARLWEVKTGHPLAVLKGHKNNVWQVGFSPDGKRVISSSWDNTVRVWDVETGELLTVLKD
jgi:VCBS repeat-containing protein